MRVGESQQCTSLDWFYIIINMVCSKPELVCVCVFQACVPSLSVCVCVCACVCVCVPSLSVCVLGSTVLVNRE